MPLDEQQPLACPSCGAHVALAEADHAACAHCGATVPIPEIYRARRRELEPVRITRAQAEAQLREIVDGAVPGWVPKLYAWTVIPVAVIGVPVALALTQSSFHWFAREWVVIGGLAPFLVALLPWLVLWAKSQPWIYLHAIGGALRPGPPLPDGRATCGCCGAPLEHAGPEALALTCAYCGSDNWVSRLGGVEPLPEQERRHRANLGDLIRAKSFQASDIKLLIWIYVPVVLASLLLFWFMLPGRGSWPPPPR